MTQTQNSSKSRYDLQIHTFGCKVNTYDTGLLQARLARAGHTIAPSAKDERAAGLRVSAAGSVGANSPRVHVLNTCAVTAEATKEAAKLARRIKSREPFATVVVTGCGAQVDGAVFDSLPAADLVIANSHKGQLETILDDYFKGTLQGRVFRSNIFRKDDLEAGGGEEQAHTRAFLKIQDGCNSFCTYCVIPFARGKSRSISVNEIVRRVKELTSSGSREIVLTGVHIGDYEDEVAGRKLVLHDLVAAVLERTDVSRLRLSSLEPVELTSELLALYRNERLCAHFHMSIQSANTRVLNGMRRNYGAEEVETALLNIAREVPGAFVGMDVIAGFPGETSDEFADTYERLARLPWTRLHVFPYSERPGTKAAAYDGVVPREERALRAQRLRELSLARFQAHAEKQIGSEKRALVLKSQASAGSSQSLTRDYWPVELENSSTGGASRDAGEEVAIRITGFKTSGKNEGVLLGQRLGSA
jgi:threonylcarbamoyladenosine tRNA methylthiotransferase MtaB